jgi:hypothetical protein
VAHGWCVVLVLLRSRSFHPIWGYVRNGASLHPAVDARATGGSTLPAKEVSVLYRTRPAGGTGPNDTDTDRIVGGSNADCVEFPFMVSVQDVEVDQPVKHICGGSVIGPRLVLTAAHCVSARSVRARAVSCLSLA